VTAASTWTGRWIRRGRTLRGRLIRRSFRLFQRLGVHVTPVDFYEPVPDTRDLDDAFFRRRSEMVGVELRLPYQLELLDQLAAYRQEYDGLPVDPTPDGGFHHDNGLYGWVDAAIYWAMLRHHRPRRVWEVGSGFSTMLAAQALAEASRQDPNYRPELVAIEPYPREFLPEVEGLTRLVQQRVQDVPAADFEALQEGDVLFIDSSHVLRAGSDVQYLYLEVIPRLAPGVLVHAHDIFLPAEYPEGWVLRERRFWTEQYLLQAFLAYNEQFEVLLSTAALHLAHPEHLQATFACYAPGSGTPGSFWFRRRPAVA
jgi:hypothetical protein